MPVMSIRSGTGRLTCTWTVPARSPPQGSAARTAATRGSARRRRIISGGRRGFDRAGRGRCRRGGGFLLPGLDLLVVAHEKVMVLLDVAIARIGTEGLLIETLGLFEISGGLVRNGEIIHESGIFRIELERLLPAKQGIPP